jgi:predicted HTH transcriptional regulator
MFQERPANRQEHRRLSRLTRDDLMTDPKTVFDRPDDHWAFITAARDQDFEGQFFDRKAIPAGTPSKSQMQDLIAEVTETVSAFANRNRQGGLIVVGVNSAGEVVGTNHFSEEQRNSIANIDPLLRNHAAQVRAHFCKRPDGQDATITLIYSPHAEHGICETPGPRPKAWVRQDAQNIQVDQARREQLMRTKRLTNWERASCCPYDEGELDKATVEAFRKDFLQNDTSRYTTQELLFKAGALIKNDDGTFSFTNAGYLFFAADPQRVQPRAYLRLIKFNATFGEPNAISTQITPPRDFTGPLTKQIRDMRTFLRQSAFFKTYRRRNPDGGFLEEPEYPFQAVDEAIVNAVAHRDYAMNLPIDCWLYKDVFVVKNPGRLEQDHHDVPAEFSLQNVRLESSPRNPRIIEWLRCMKTPEGSAFVLAMGEGTNTMRNDMQALGLPAPQYKQTDAHCTLILTSNAAAREAALQPAAAPTTFTNLYELTSMNPLPEGDERKNLRRTITSALANRLTSAGWFIDSQRFGRISTHHVGTKIPLAPNVEQFVRIYPAYTIQVRDLWNKFYLCVDYDIQVKNVRTLQTLAADLEPATMIGMRCLAKHDGWQHGKIISADAEHTTAYLYDFKEEVTLPSTVIIPQLPIRFIKQLLQQHKITTDLSRQIKEASLSLRPQAARTRAEKTTATIAFLAQQVFPLSLPTTTITITPAPLALPPVDDPGRLQVIAEPSVEFNQHRSSSNIREGITKFGAYEEHDKTIEIVPICTGELRTAMGSLIERLKTGSYQYRGSERTFKAKLTHSTIMTVSTTSEILPEIKRLLGEHPDWEANPALNRLFLVCTPVTEYDRDDETSPYYQIKRYLLERGIPCQMVNRTTIMDPNWKDLNLALNVAAKCGITPWVLPDAIPDADFFIGLSYTSSGRGQRERYLGYANVFSNYGRWEFYTGGGEPVLYEQRTAAFHDLITNTLKRLDLPHAPHISFHYSAKFSREDRASILAAAQAIRPEGRYTFVWINTGHEIRLYDQRPETDGSIARGTYLSTAKRQFYLSTTGFNPYRKTLGTPVALEINVTPHDDRTVIDHRSVATQILSLTKLNWASTDSLCAEPITTKYAGDIAYLTAAFLRQQSTFKLHPLLEQTPWFI